MPNSVSSKKRVRQNATRRARNQWRLRRIKEQIKVFLKAVHDQDATAAETEFRKTSALLDRIAATKTIHANNAARRKSRLHKRLKDIGKKPAAAAAR